MFMLIHSIDGESLLLFHVEQKRFKWEWEVLSVESGEVLRNGGGERAQICLPISGSDKGYRARCRRLGDSEWRQPALHKFAEPTVQLEFEAIDREIIIEDEIAVVANVPSGVAVFLLPRMRLHLRPGEKKSYVAKGQLGSRACIGLRAGEFRIEDSRLRCVNQGDVVGGYLSVPGSADSFELSVDSRIETKRHFLVNTPGSLADDEMEKLQSSMKGLGQED